MHSLVRTEPRPSSWYALPGEVPEHPHVRTSGFTEVFTRQRIVTHAQAKRSSKAESGTTAAYGVDSGPIIMPSADTQQGRIHP